MIILVEGLDNVGKTTLIKNINTKFFSSPVHILKYDGELIDKTNLTEIKLSKQLAMSKYFEMFYILQKCYSLNLNVIVDRTHLGDHVYAPLYRGYFADYIPALEQNIKCNYPDFFNNLILIYLSDTIENVLKRDDNLTFSIDLQQKLKEKEAFNYIISASLIPNKIFINTQPTAEETYLECLKQLKEINR